MKYFLDQDHSCHWYLVEASRRKDWDEWLEIDEEDPASWETPEFATRVNGTQSSIEFELKP